MRASEQERLRLNAFFLIGGIGKPSDEEVAHLQDVEKAAQYAVMVSPLPYDDIPISSRRLYSLAIFRLAQETLSLMDLDVMPIMRPKPTPPPVEEAQEILDIATSIAGAEPVVVTPPVAPTGTESAIAAPAPYVAQPAAEVAPVDADDALLAEAFGTVAEMPETVGEPVGQDPEVLRQVRHLTVYLGLTNKGRIAYRMAHSDFNVDALKDHPTYGDLHRQLAEGHEQEKVKAEGEIACSDCGHAHEGGICTKQVGVDQQTTRPKYCGCQFHNPVWPEQPQPVERLPESELPVDAAGRGLSERTAAQAFAQPEMALAPTPPLPPASNVTDVSASGVAVKPGSDLHAEVARMVEEKREAEATQQTTAVSPQPNAPAVEIQQPQAPPPAQPAARASGIKEVTAIDFWPDPPMDTLDDTATERRMSMLKRIQDYWDKTVRQPDGQPRTDLNHFSTSYRVGLAGRLLGMAVDNWAKNYELAPEQQQSLEDRVKGAAVNFVNAHKPLTGSLALEGPEPNWETYVARCQSAGQAIGTPLEAL